MTANQIILLSTRSDGEACWRLGETEYTYLIDAARLDHITRLSRRAPGRAFNLTKKHGTLIKKGDNYVNQPNHT